MTINKRNRLIRRHANTIAERDGRDAVQHHLREYSSSEIKHGHLCCEFAHETAAHDTYHHLTRRCVYVAPTGRVHLAIGLPAIQRLLAEQWMNTP